MRKLVSGALGAILLLSATAGVVDAAPKGTPSLAVSPTYQKAQLVSGKTTKGAKVKVLKGKQTVGKTVKAKSTKFKIKLKQQFKPGTKLMVVATKSGKTKTKIIKVKKSTLPKLATAGTAINVTATKISGQNSTARAKITAKIGTKLVGTTTVKKNGKWTVTLKGTPLTIGQKVVLVATHPTTKGVRKVTRKVVDAQFVNTTAAMTKVDQWTNDPVLGKMRLVKITQLNKSLKRDVLTQKITALKIIEVTANAKQQTAGAQYFNRKDMQVAAKYKIAQIDYAVTNASASYLITSLGFDAFTLGSTVIKNSRENYLSGMYDTSYTHKVNGELTSYQLAKESQRFTVAGLVDDNALTAKKLVINMDIPCDVESGNYVGDEADVVLEFDF